MDFSENNFLGIISEQSEEKSNGTLNKKNIENFEQCENLIEDND